VRKTIRARAASLFGRMGLPDDIARAVVFLASAEAGFVTVQMLIVDGGLNLDGNNLLRLHN
jgi:NAD(P)-dependent dehydrogenase (short-subunit alcohol dehydrogenase family)